MENQMGDAMDKSFGFAVLNTVNGFLGYEGIEK